MPRVSTNDQQTLPMQIRAMREYAARRDWTIALQVREVGSSAGREKPVRNCWRLPVAVRSMWCSYGDWTAGADPSQTCWQPFRNWSISVLVSSR
jgi:hypothetical protein